MIVNRKYRPEQQVVVGVVMHQPREVVWVARSAVGSALPLMVVFPEASLTANVSCWVTGVLSEVSDPRVVASVARSAEDSALHQAAVSREAVAMVAPRLPWALEELVSFWHPNESEYLDTKQMPRPVLCSYHPSPRASGALATAASS